MDGWIRVCMPRRSSPMPLLSFHFIASRCLLSYTHTHPHTPTQEELDQEARELGEEAVGPYNRARGGGAADGADAFGAIARSNAAALLGDDGACVAQQRIYMYIYVFCLRWMAPAPAPAPATVCLVLAHSTLLHVLSHPPTRPPARHNRQAPPAGAQEEGAGEAGPLPVPRPERLRQPRALRPGQAARGGGDDPGHAGADGPAGGRGRLLPPEV